MHPLIKIYSKIYFLVLFLMENSSTDLSCLSSDSGSFFKQCFQRKYVLIYIIEQAEVETIKSQRKCIAFSSISGNIHDLVLSLQIRKTNWKKRFFHKNNLTKYGHGWITSWKDGGKSFTIIPRNRLPDVPLAIPQAGISWPSLNVRYFPNSFLL